MANPAKAGGAKLWVYNYAACIVTIARPPKRKHGLYVLLSGLEEIRAVFVSFLRSVPIVWARRLPDFQQRTGDTMQHHEPEMGNEMKQWLNSIPRAEVLFGPTGRSSEGKLTENGEGESSFEVTAFQGKVVVNFGKSIESMGLSAEQARQLALALRQRAIEIECSQI